MAVEVREVRGWEDLQRWVALRNEAAPDVLTADMRTLVRALELDYVDLLALEDGEPVGTAFISGDPASAATRRPWFDLRVPERNRGRGIGTALFQAVEYHALRLGHEALKTAVREDDAAGRAFLDRLGFAASGGWQQFSLELPEDELPARTLPATYELVALEERPDLLDGMYAAAVEFGAELRGKLAGGTLSQAQWRTYELGSPLVRFDLTLIALEGDRVRGYAVLQDFPGRDVLYHRGIAGPDPVAETLVAAQAGLAAAVGTAALIAVPRSVRLQALFQRLGYRPRWRWLHYERALA